MTRAITHREPTTFFLTHLPMDRFSIRVAGDDLRFSAAHFITLEADQCEPIHGHDFGVSVRIGGELGDQGYVVDFVAIKDAVKQAIDLLDHSVLLPAKHPLLRLCESEDEVEITFADRRWVFPRGDCVILPLANTTAEELARYLGRRIRDALAPLAQGKTLTIKIELTEGPGYSAVWQSD